MLPTLLVRGTPGSPGSHKNYLAWPQMGRTLFVWSAHAKSIDANNRGVDPERPLRTLAAALTAARSNDVIYVGPGHTESVVTADGLNIASTKTNVRVIGLGNACQRPKFTFGTLTTADFMVSGAGAFLQNLWLHCDIDAQAKMLAIAAADVLVQDLLISAATGKQPVDAISATAAANDLTIERVTASLLEAGQQSCILFGACDNVQIRDCKIMGNFGTASGAAIKNDAAGTGCLIERNYTRNLNTDGTHGLAGIRLHASTTGCIRFNQHSNPTDASLVAIVAAAGNLFENYLVNVDGETGILEGTPSA